MTDAQVTTDIDARWNTNSAFAITGLIGNDILKNTIWGNIPNKVITTYGGNTGAIVDTDTILIALSKVKNSYALKSSLAIDASEVAIGTGTGITSQNFFYATANGVAIDPALSAISAAWLTLGSSTSESASLKMLQGGRPDILDMSGGEFYTDSRGLYFAGKNESGPEWGDVMVTRTFRSVEGKSVERTMSDYINTAGGGIRTYSIPAASADYKNSRFFFYNEGSGTMRLDAAGSDLFDFITGTGLISTYDLAPKNSGRIVCDGTHWLLSK